MESRRLAGLASAAMGLSATLAGMAAMPGAWERVENVDETNEKRTIGFVLEGETVALSVSCKPIPVVAFSFSDTSLFDAVKWKKAKVRFDGEMSVSPRLFRRGDLVLPDPPGNLRGEFLLAILDHERLSLKLPLRSGGAIRENFALAGLGDLLESEPLCDLTGEISESGFARTRVDQASETGPFLAGMGDVTTPTLLRKSRVSPNYPPEARRRRLEGNVILEVTISEEGRVTDARVLRTNQPGVGFEEEALRTVRKWLYEPATRQGVPVEVLFTVFIEFKLN